MGKQVMEVEYLGFIIAKIFSWNSTESLFPKKKELKKKKELFNKLILKKKKKKKKNLQKNFF